jgi:hypothetical protein
MRPSRQGKYLSLTCVVNATSREQLDALYPGVVRPPVGRVGALMRADQPPLMIKRLGSVEYVPTLEAMRALTTTRGADTVDELWVLEHPRVYTLGVRSDPRHLPRIASDIAIVRCNRGGEITYHGPGRRSCTRWWISGVARSRLASSSGCWSNR